MPDQIADFLNGIRASDNTKKTYVRALHVFACWSGKEAPDSQAEAQDFLNFRVDQGRAASTIEVDAAALSRYLKWKKLPVDRFERPPVTLQSPKYLSKPEVSALLAACEGSAVLSCIAALLYDSGARITEILGIRMNEIDWEGFLPIIRKGGRKDVTNVSAWGMGYLKSWLETRQGHHPLVFGDRDYKIVYNALKAAAKGAGIAEFHPHMLRHSRAVHLSQDSDLTWEEIGYQLGHVNPATTVKIYTRPNPEDLKKLVPAPAL